MRPPPCFDFWNADTANRSMNHFQVVNCYSAPCTCTHIVTKESLIVANQLFKPPASQRMYIVQTTPKPNSKK